MGQPKSDVLQGTLDLMILKTLDTLGAMHGWGIAQRIRQVSGDLLQLNQGTLYPALLRVEQKGWISSEWKITENNRRAKYYSLAAARASTSSPPPAKSSLKPRRWSGSDSSVSWRAC